MSAQQKQQHQVSAQMQMHAPVKSTVPVAGTHHAACAVGSLRLHCSALWQALLRRSWSLGLCAGFSLVVALPVAQASSADSQNVALNKDAAIEAAVATKPRADSLLVGEVAQQLPQAEASQSHSGATLSQAETAHAAEEEEELISVAMDSEGTEEPLDLETKAKLDPLAQEEPSFWQRLFSFNSANASEGDIVTSYQNTFFIPELMTSLQPLQDQAAAGQVDLVSAVPFKFSEDMLTETGPQEQVMLEQILHGISFISYLLHMYTPQTMDYNVPVLFVDAAALDHVSKAYNIRKGTTLVGSGKPTLEANGVSSQKQQEAAALAQARQKRDEHIEQVNQQLNNLSIAVDGVYGAPEQAEQGVATLVQDQGATTTATVVGPEQCQGMTVIEADLKGKCRSEQQYNGMVVLSLPVAEVLREGIFSAIPQQVTPNVLQANYFAQGVDLGMRLVGVNSSYEPRNGSFTAPLHSFDKHLYSPSLQQYVKPELSFAQIGKDCSQGKQDGECQLYFVGQNLNNLLQAGNEFSAFNLKQQASLDVGTPYAAINRQSQDLKTQGQDEREEQVAEAAEQAVEDAQDGKLPVDGAIAASGAASENALAAAVDASEEDDLQDNLSDIMDAVISSDDESSEESSAELAAASNAGNASASDANASNASVASAEPAPAPVETQEPAQKKVTLANVLAAEANTAAQMASSAKRKVAERISGTNDTAYSDAAGQNLEIRSEKQDLYGIPVTFSALGKPLLGLRNTLLSDDQYKNYTFLTEAEMAVLSDLGYRIEPREFFGRSIYSFGSPERRIVRTVQNDFALYDHATELYEKRKPSQTPLAVGLHLYGSYNDVVHSGNVLMAGSGSIGVRVDGSENFYYQTNKSSIIASGDSNVGLGFTYGRDNRAYISGHISALGRQGIGIKVDMGSNIYSDLVEYRGSYIRVRTLDYLHGIVSELDAARVPLLDDLNGPQISELIIDGEVEGSDAAIYIDESSFVKSINVTSNARLTGGIYSTWNPRSTGTGDILVSHDAKRSVIDAVVQYPRDPHDSLTGNEFITNFLNTDINLGVTLDERNRVLYTDSSKRLPLGNDQSRVVLSGDVSSNTFKLRHIAGKSTILGNVRASSVDVFSGILSLCSPQDFATNQIGSLRVHNNAVLDYVNGKSSNTYVQSNVVLGSNVTIRVDVDAEGRILDEVSWNGDFNVRNYQFTVEPGMPYNEIRRLSADPKAMLNFIANFMQSANQKFSVVGVTVRVPNYIWDSAGNYGRELKCNARGCRIGAFTSSNALKTSITNAERWRYIVSFSGLVLLILGTYAYFYVPRVLAKRKAKKEQEQA